MVGEWKLENMKPCELPQKLSTEVEKLLNSMQGASYMPVLYCAEQNVNGTNHMFICKQSLTTAQPVEHLTKVILHEPLPTNPKDSWKIESIEPFL